MTVREYLTECYPDQEFQFVDGFDEAIIGLEYRDWKVVYSIPKIVDVLIETTPLTEDEAVEFFHYNIGCIKLGDQTPLFVETNWENILG